MPSLNLRNKRRGHVEKEYLIKNTMTKLRDNKYTTR